MTRRPGAETWSVRRSWKENTGARQVTKLEKGKKSVVYDSMTHNRPE